MDTLNSKNLGKHPDTLEIQSRVHEKSQDLRYGTNPAQTAALYGLDTFLGTLREISLENIVCVGTV